MQYKTISTSYSRACIAFTIAPHDIVFVLLPEDGTKKLIHIPAPIACFRFWRFDILNHDILQEAALVYFFEIYRIAWGCLLAYSRFNDIHRKRAHVVRTGVRLSFPSCIIAPFLLAFLLLLL